MAPSSGTSGSRVTSAASRDTVPSPQAYGSSGRAAASASPARIPTEVSSAELTTAGSPACATISRARRTPPSGATLTTIRSAAPARATLRGSSSLRTLSSAAISTGTPAARSRRRTSARPAMSGTGCSAYSSPTAASRVSASTAAGMSQPPFASTRIAASGSASRTAATRAASSSRLWPRSATLTLTASTRPKRARISGTRVRRHGGDRGVDRDAVPQRRRETLPAGLDRGGKPAGGLRVAIFGEGAEFPQPSGPRSSRASRCRMPRNFTRIGRLTTWAPARSSSRPGRGTAGRCRGVHGEGRHGATVLVCRTARPTWEAEAMGHGTGRPRTGRLMSVLDWAGVDWG